MGIAISGRIDETENSFRLGLRQSAVVAVLRANIHGTWRR